MSKEFNEIIAIRFGSMVYFGEKALLTLKVKEDYDQLYSRAEFRMLSKCDLGDKWGKYAEQAPTLFRLNDDTSMDIRIPKWQNLY